MVSEFLDVLSIFETVLVVRRYNVAKNVLVLLFNFVGESYYFSVHMLHLFLYFLFEKGQTRLLLFTVANCLTNLLVVVNVAVC